MMLVQQNNRMYRREVNTPSGKLDVIVVDNAFCYAEIALQGAQVIQFYSKKHQRDILWCAEQDTLQLHKAIRGGIPLCFPWFGNHKTNATLPAHGFARQSIWNLTQVNMSADGEHRLVFTLSDNPETRKIWDYGFKLELKMHFAEALTIDLIVINQDTQPFEYEFALHSYFKISDIHNIQVKGLEACEFMDKLNPSQGIQTEDQPITISQETDRVYQDAKQQYELIDVSHKINITSEGCHSAVIWNPWQEKAAKLSELKPQDWHHFVCIETGQIATHQETLEAGQSKQYRLNIQIL